MHPDRKIPAIVLTYDRNRQVAAHMMASYNRLWPDHPFEFHVPYQKRQGVTADDRVRYVPTPREICKTVLTMLEGRNDEEWLYWCIDDYYPVQLDIPRLMALAGRILREDLTQAQGLNFCSKAKKTRLWRNGGVKAGTAREIVGLRWVAVRGYEQIWIHQFLRCGVLRHLFRTMPEPKAGAKEMDGLISKIERPAQQALWLSERDLAVFGESTSRGVPTRNFLRSLQKRGAELDPVFSGKGVAKPRFRGKMGPLHHLERLFTVGRSGQRLAP
ncbi:MAG: hypothetical protein EXQ88_07040 [Alphaproteobacteria bacterium]|nr:hypothetical protein [Alphaproteobacteria bacterium]